MGRALVATNSGTPALSAPNGRTRQVLGLALEPPHPYVITPVRLLTSSPPRSVLIALSGLPPRPNRMGSGFWRCSASSIVMRRRSFCACSASAAAPGATTFVGCASRPPDESTTCPNRPSWKCSVTVNACGMRTSIPSNRSRSVTDEAGSETVCGDTVPVPQARTADEFTWV